MSGARGNLLQGFDETLTLTILPRTPRPAHAGHRLDRLQHPTYSALAYCDPWSEWCTSLGRGCRLSTAMRRAASGKLASRLRPRPHPRAHPWAHPWAYPTERRENASNTTAKNTNSACGRT
jgi:hypothetical protein